MNHLSSPAKAKMYEVNNVNPQDLGTPNLAYQDVNVIPVYDEIQEHRMTPTAWGPPPPYDGGQYEGLQVSRVDVSTYEQLDPR